MCVGLHEELCVRVCKPILAVRVCRGAWAWCLWVQVTNVWTGALSVCASVLTCVHACAERRVVEMRAEVGS